MSNKKTKKAKKDYSATCNLNDEDMNNRCGQCTRFCFPIGCMVYEDGNGRAKVEKEDKMVLNSLAYKMFCSQNLEEVVRDHDGKGYINFAVDFDGVLCKSAYPDIGEPNTEMIQYLIKQREKKNKVILWTARTGEDLQKAIDWCADFGLGFDYVNRGDPTVEEMYRTPGQLPPRKVYADVYIDDRNMAPLNIWPVQYSEEEVEASKKATNSDLREFDDKKLTDMSGYELYTICKWVGIDVEKKKERSYYLKKLLGSEKESDIADAFVTAMESPEMVEDKVVHKAEHYQNGEFEVIDEMVIVFGVEATLQFCRLNAWKYRARAAYKGSAAEDMKKSDEYLKMAWELEKRRQRQCPPQSLDTKDLYVLIGDRE